MYSISRKGKPNNLRIDYGMSDYYKFYKSKYMDNEEFNISSKEYNEIVSDYNLGIKDLILNDNFDFKIPFNMGILGLRKYKPNIKIKDNKIVTNNLPINPRETRKLWDSNPEAKSKKIYIRYTNKHSDGYVFTVHYFRSTARFKNKTAYKITLKREFKRKVSERAIEKSIDAFIL